MTVFKSFLIQQIALTSVLALISWFLFSIASEAWTTHAWPYLLLFFMLTNGLLFWMYIKAMQKKLSKFANFFMIATFSKLILYLAIIVVYLIFNRADVAPFTLTFFIYYLFYTFVEVRAIVKMQKLSNN